MRALGLGIAIVALGTGLWAGSARADAPPPSYPPGYTPVYAPTLTYDWTGIYFGGNVGGVTSMIEWTYDGTPDRLRQSHNGFAGGAFAGVQKQLSWIVLGAEVGYLWVDQPASSTSASDPTTTLTTNVRNLLLVSGKLGWTWDNILGYLKGGYASGQMDFRTSGTLVTSSSGRENGWIVGAGLEYALWDHVILGAEYNYIMLNSNTHDQIPGPGGPVGTHAGGGVDLQSVTARLSFKFGGVRTETVPTK
jgi:outer membrane immunogenic protein